jgi:hypothetical protein
MHHVHHIVDGAFQMQYRRRLRQDFRRQRPDNVNAQHFAKFLVRHDLDKSAMIPKNGGLAVTNEGKFADLYCVSRIPRLFLC